MSGHGAVLIKLIKYPFSEIEKGIFIKFNWVIWKAENF